MNFVQATPAEKQEISQYFEAVENDFSPPLSERILKKSDVESYHAYAEKVLQLGYVFCCRINDRIAGLIILYANDQDKGIAYIPILSVQKTHKGKGIGSHLIKMAENKAREQGMKVLHLKTWPSNSAAIRLYTQSGFQKEVTENDLIFNKMLT